MTALSPGAGEADTGPEVSGQPRRKPRRRRADGGSTPWEGLTPAEVQVAVLAADGLTNRQIGAELFISRRTVETHLAHIYQKLGFSSRAQVAAEVARRQAQAMRPDVIPDIRRL